MRTDLQNASSAKESIIRKIDTLPDALVQTVSTILDGLIAYHKATAPVSDFSETGADVSKESSEPVTTWDQFFDELQKLPEAPALVNMTKQQKKNMMTKYLEEKYRDTDLDLS